MNNILMSTWIQHVKDYQNKNNCSYKQALSNASATYQKGGSISNGTLNELISSGYKSAKNKSTAKKEQTINGYVKDTQLSGRRSQVFHNPVTNQSIINENGTQTIQDVGTDALYSLGLLKDSKRYKHSKLVQKQVKDKYGSDDKNITYTGHSLGSVLSQDVAPKESEVYTVNKPVSLFDMNKIIKDNQTDIKVAGGPVSILRPLQKRKKAKVIKNESINPLTNHSSDNLNRVNDDVVYGNGVSTSRIVPQEESQQLTDDEIRLRLNDEINEYTNYHKIPKKQAMNILTRGRVGENTRRLLNSMMSTKKNPLK